jgi:hypothetical protein
MEPVKDLEPAKTPGADAPTEPLTLGWLKQFASPDESRIYIGSPFYADGFAYATDGHLAVRIPSESFEAERWTDRNKETVLKAFAREGGQWWTITPPLESPIEEVACSTCSGTGTHECHACYHEDDCSDCDGTGKQQTSASTEIAGVLFNVATLGRVWKLRGFALKVHEVDALSAHLFRFNGGGGVIMPIRRKMETHIDVAPQAAQAAPEPSPAEGSP